MIRIITIQVLIKVQCDNLWLNVQLEVCLQLSFAVESIKYVEHTIDFFSTYNYLFLVASILSSSASCCSLTLRERFLSRLSFILKIFRGIDDLYLFVRA